MSDYMNLKTDFGAIGNGVTDDSSAINSAFSSCAASGKRLYIPQSTYNCGTTALTSPGGFQIEGDYGATFIWGVAFTGTGLTITGPNQRIRHLGLLIPNKVTIPTTTLIGLDVQKHLSQLEDVIVGGFGIGNYQGWYTGAQFAEWTHSLDSCNITGQVYGIIGNANALAIEKTVASAAESTAISGIGIYIKSGSGISISGCDIEGNSAYNILIGNPNTTTGYVSGVDIGGCYMEGAAFANLGIYGDPTHIKNKGINIHGNFIYSENIASYGIWAENCTGIAIYGNSCEGAVTDSIYIPASGGITIASYGGNYTDKPIVT